MNDRKSKKKERENNISNNSLKIILVELKKKREIEKSL